MQSVYNLTLEELINYFLNINEKSYRANQLFEWLYKKGINNFTEITNMSKKIINQLNRDFYLDNMTIIKEEHDNDVSKYLFQLSDDNYIESVLMNHNYGNSLCISTQVGCSMGCLFCESGRLKKKRNLETSELILQVLKVQNMIKKRISHVVVMGIGEPFDNYINLCKFIEIINHPKGIAIGARHITISTCGITPKIKEFMKLPYQINLAISLHAPNDKLRNQIMPINKRYSITDLINVIKEYIEKTNRRITFEYILLRDINDRKEHAIELSKLLQGINCYVNLIPYNETNNNQYKRSKKDTIKEFYDILKKNNIIVTIRMEFGSNISAACGQLRSKKEEA
ncbi:MAG: 23S rRNA (adenine(2503)-C(2))-methyltransferase RlmN [Tenericutes bacterium]|nr:23S rRNA (adenine(2503)-C(2))-methyltransferase RlmN [Mycoplasmatota bacterium]